MAQICALAWLFVVLTTWAVAQPFSSTPSDHAFFSLMARAKQSAQMGNVSEAHALWAQAKALRPATSRPGWLDSPPPARVNQSVDPEQVIQSSIGLPYPDAKSVLEGYLANNPGETRVRKALTRLAHENKDKLAVLRHGSILETKEPVTYISFGVLIRYLLVGLLCIVLVRELYKTFKLLKH